MGTSRWKPLPTDLPSPARDLAMRMRALLDDRGLSLRQFAASDDVHYSVTTLQRYFSGQALPPRQLIEVISRRCGGDPNQLDALYERASKAEVPGSAENNGLTTVAEPAPPHPEPARNAGRRRWMIVAAVSVLLGAAATFGIMSILVDDNPATGYQLVVNGSFDNLDDEPEDDDGFAKWWTSEDGKAQVDSQGGLAQITVHGGTKNLWDVAFGQSGITITEGDEYTLRFTAWADKAVRIGARVQVENPPYDAVLNKAVPLASAPEEYVYSFIAGFSTGKGQVVFHLGGEGEDYTMYLDNVSLIENGG